MDPARKLEDKLDCKRCCRFPKKDGIVALEKVEKIFKTCNIGSWLKAGTEMLKLFLERSGCLCLESSKAMSKCRSQPWIILCDKPKYYRLMHLPKSTTLLLESLM